MGHCVTRCSHMTFDSADELTNVYQDFCHVPALKKGHLPNLAGSMMSRLIGTHGLRRFLWTLPIWLGHWRPMDSESFATSTSNKQISTVPTNLLMISCLLFMNTWVIPSHAKWSGFSVLQHWLFACFPCQFWGFSKMIELTALIQLQHAAALELVAITTGAGGQCPKLTGRW